MNRALLVAALAVASPCAAQTLQASAQPVAGTITAQPDRPAEALDLSVRAVSETGMDDCPGFIDPSAPDAVVEWRGGGPLQITTRADFDATLVVARPDGTWACNDDGDGLQPVVEIANAARGRYAVWVGSYSDTPAASAVTLTAGSPPPPIVPDLRARPTAGTMRVSANFEAQNGPTTQAVQVRGRDALSRAELGDTSECYGYIDASAPSLVVAYTEAPVVSVPLAISATTGGDLMEPADLVLLVHTPGGEWVCNDDYAGSDPAVVFDAPDTGDYTVWVGTYGSLAQNATVSATVTVSETAPEGGFDDMDSDYDMGPSEPYSEGHYMPIEVDVRALVTLQVGDAPAEASATVTDAGSNPVSGARCSGNIAAVATADVLMSGVGPLAISASSPDEHDLVMVVHTPDGRWFCSDDADGLNPGVQFGTADDPTVEAGTYRVWVGPFSTWNDDTMEDEVVSTEPVPVMVRAERGELTVSVRDDMDFGIDMGMDRPMFTEGAYAGTALRSTEALQTLRAGATGASVQAGGVLINPVDGDACSGFIDARPTFDVSAENGELLHIDASAEDEDLVMVVRTPTGRWLCSDDAEGKDPAIDTDEDGRHAVWIGTFSRRAGGVAATASVTSVGTRM